MEWGTYIWQVFGRSLLEERAACVRRHRAYTHVSLSPSLILAYIYATI